MSTHRAASSRKRPAGAGTTTMTLRLPSRLKEKMERLARATARSRSFLAVEAIESYVADNEWQIEAIREGVADADAGRFVEHEEVAAWLSTWGAPKTKAGKARGGRRR